MSAEGWHIVHCGIFFFVFEKGEPKNKEYFTYGLSAQEGKYNIELMHPFLEKRYGVKAKRSKINANRSKSLQIVEIDTDKIDVNNDIGYKELISDRNSLSSSSRAYSYTAISDSSAEAKSRIAIARRPRS